MKYGDFVALLEELSATTKRLIKTKVLSDFIIRTDPDDLHQSMLLLQGLVYPPWDERKLGVADKLAIKSINVASGIESSRIESEWKELGDLGLVAEKLIGKKQQVTLFSKELLVKDVFFNLRKLAEAMGQGSVDMKVKLIAELLSNASGLEAKYIIRIVLNDLRIGLGDGTIRDAIVWANFRNEIGFHYDEGSIEVEDRALYNSYIDLVQSAYDMTNDFSKVAYISKKEGKIGLENVGISIFEPVKVMLFPKASGIKEAFETVGKPAAFEYKYDGFRMQIHKQEEKIMIFTRNLENVTAQFPEVISYIRRNVAGHNFIIDAEAVGIENSTGRYLPFQSISQRIKRKYDIEKLSKELPVELNIFDIILHDGKNLIKHPFKERRWVLEKIVNPVEKKIILSKQIITDDENEAQLFYEEALKKGFEGIMGKSLDGIYKPGKRVGYGIKIKPTMESLDLVIVAAEWGEGKRSSWITSYTIACQDEGDLIEVGKVSSGLKELDEEGLSFNNMTSLIKPLIIKEEGKQVIVKPQIVIEVTYEEIQKSPTYTSGFALRFPRILRLREDRGLDDISTLELVHDLYDQQKGKNNL